jgi:hypothetical protein
MKNLELSDILQRSNPQLKRVSIFQNGAWVFVLFPREAITRVDDGVRYIRAAERFGLVYENENNPKQISVYGDPGDYICIDRTNVISKITKSQYHMMFPTPVQNPPLPYTTQKALDDPRFLTDIFEKQS